VGARRPYALPVKLKLPRPRLPNVPWRRIATGRVLPWTLVVLLLGAALAGWLVGGGSDSGRIDQVKQTATRFLDALTNFSASTIDQDVKRIRSYAVGSFAQQVDQTFSPARIQQIKQAKVVSKATVKSVFVENLTGDQATVFGVVAVTVTNNVQSAPRSDVIRAELTLLDTKGGWKVEQVNIFQAPGATG
jgi:hypothetical protein